MSTGLAKEATMANRRREAVSQSGYDEPKAAPLPRPRLRKSLNSRYENDLGNIASFDRAPAKPSFAPRDVFAAGDDVMAAAGRTTKSSLRKDGDINPDAAWLEREEGNGGGGRIWRKLQAPVPKEPLDRDLENILFPEPKQPPHSSSDPHSYYLKTPPLARIYGRNTDSEGAQWQGGHGSSQPFAGSPSPNYRGRPSGRKPMHPRVPGPIAMSHDYPSYHQSVPQSTSLAHDYHQDSSYIDPADISTYRYNGPYPSLPQNRQLQPNHAFQHAPPRPPMPHDDYIPTKPQKNPTPYVHLPFNPKMAPSYPPIQTDGYPPSNIQHPYAYPSSGQRTQWRDPYTPQVPPQVVLPPFMDPSTQPIPIYDQNLRQWILVPPPPPPPALPLPNTTSNTGRKRPADSSSPSSIPQTLEVAYQHIATPDRPRRVPSGVGVDMRPKKTGKALIKSLETQVEEESSSADELNLRSPYQQPRQRQQNHQASSFDDFFDDDEHPPLDQPVPNTSTVRRKSTQAATVSAPQMSSAQSPEPMYEQYDPDSASSEEPDEPSLPPQHRQSGHYHRQSHFHPEIRSDKTQHGRHRHPHKRHRSDYQSESSTRAKEHQRHPRDTHHRDSRNSRIKTSLPSHSSRHDSRRDQQKRTRQPSYSPSSTETDSNSGHYDSSSDSDSQDTFQEDFTSPSNTPDSPSPIPSDRRVRVTEGAWAGYDVPAHLVHVQSIPPDPTIKRSRSKRRNIKSLPLLPHQRPRDSSGKWLPYAYTRSESVSPGGGAEMEVEDELDGVGEREDIEVFSTPSQEDRTGGTRGGLSPVQEVDEDVEMEDEDVGMDDIVEIGKKGKQKKSVRWDKGVKDQDAGSRKGVNRLPKGWNLELGDEEMGEMNVVRDKDGQEGPDQDGSGGRGDNGAAVYMPEKTQGMEKAGNGVSPFGEGFFGTEYAGDVGFTVWRDGH